MIADRFELLVEIGKGGMGRISRSHDRVLDEEIALKVLRPELVDSKEMSQRFRKEVRLARKVSHPNVCHMYDYGEDGKVHYITMEFVDGVDLKKTLLRRKKGLHRAEAFGAVASVATGLQAIHDEGIIHRDLKTQNIMIDTKGIVRLMDFGIAKDNVKAGPALTQVGMAIGTPEYMSPEQCQAKPIDQRSDIYSLGLVRYEAFTGTVPFYDPESPMKTMLAQIKDPPPFEKAVKQGLPKSLVVPLQRALAKEPETRFSTVAEFAKALEKARLATKSALGERVTDLREQDRRRDRRLDIIVNCWIRVVGGGNTIVQQEQTIGENISSGGVRVRTSITHLAKGERIMFEEVGGAFRTRAQVCGYTKGVDKIDRLHLKFVDHAAPRYLTGSGEAESEPRSSS